MIARNEHGAGAGDRDPGVGKSHLSTALGVQAIKNGFSVAHFVLDDLMHVLKADAATAPARLRARRYFNCALLIIDELGFRPLDRMEANLFFRLVSARYERGSMLLTSNRHVRDWPEIFAGDEILTTAILDRLLHHVAVVHIDGQSYRLRELGPLLSPPTPSDHRGTNQRTTRLTGRCGDLPVNPLRGLGCTCTFRRPARRSGCPGRARIAGCARGGNGVPCRARPRRARWRRARRRTCSACCMSISSSVSLRQRIPTISDQEFLCVDVRDTGHGMDQATSARVFEPFFTTKAEHGGSGLGLAMVYGLMKQQDGFVSLESTPGFGTVVSLLFPLSNGRVARTPTPEAGYTEAPRPQGTAARVLFVDDDEPIRNVARRALERAGFEVHTASDGAHALEVLDSLASLPDAIVTDLMMPSMGGAALRDVVRARYPAVRFVFTSGYSEEGLPLPPHVQGRETTRLAKPWTAAELVSAVRNVLPEG